MRILIADSGSTKTEWRLVDNGHVEAFSTEGLNPYYQSQEQIRAVLKVQLPIDKLSEIEACYFYGAGNTDEVRRDVVRHVISETLNPVAVSVEGDMLGAARGLLGTSSGIAGILGTGSNSCYYDGNQIVKNVAAGGFILGDEGSGAQMGKMLLRDFLRNRIPEHLYRELTNTGLNKNEILKNVYDSELPNRYLAGYTKFLKQYIDQDYCKEVVRRCLSDYINQHILGYSESNEVVLTGSIAYHFKDELKYLADAVGINILKIEQNPIKGLIEYHR